MLTERAVREKSQRTRGRILEAAERLFADKGFAETSMRDIAGAAKVNLSSAYYYFKDKEDLLLAVMERFIMPVLTRERELLDAARAAAGTAPIAPRPLVEAVILPRMMDVSEVCRQIVVRLFVCPEESEKKILAGVSGMTRAMRAEFFKEFRRTFPHLSAEETRFRLANMEALLNGWRSFVPLFFLEEKSEREISKETYCEMFVGLVIRIFSSPATLPPQEK